VLICEDDPDAAALLAAVIGSAGYETEVAHDADETRKLVACHHFDVVTVDIMLPGEDGCSLIRWLHDHDDTKDIAVVVVAANADVIRMQRDAADLPVADWLSKPVDHARLLTAIRGAGLKTAVVPRRPRVLYVEDDPSLRQIVSALLCESFDVVVASTLAEARRHIAQDGFDLGILDVALPDGSGLELLDSLKGSRPDAVPVIIFSGIEVDEETARHVEAVLLKTKTSNDALLQTVRRVIDDAPAVERVA
jgi:DNA-binding response OmpR family regulator